MAEPVKIDFLNIALEMDGLTNPTLFGYAFELNIALDPA